MGRIRNVGWGPFKLPGEDKRIERAGREAEEIMTSFKEAQDRSDRRPCKGRNTNVCVAEGCYGEACLKMDYEAYTGPVGKYRLSISLIDKGTYYFKDVSKEWVDTQVHLLNNHGRLITPGSNFVLIEYGGCNYYINPAHVASMVVNKVE